MLKPASFKKGKTTRQYTPKRSKRDKIGASYTPRIAPSWYEMEVKKKKTLRQCSRCGAVYLDNHWHTIPDFAKIYARSLPKKEITKELCAECNWIKGGKDKTGWEGELILENLVPEEKNEILNLVRNVGKRAFLRDPEDQIIKIEDMGSKVRITTTENQLAASIGKQVSWAFKGGKLEIKWSDEDAPARVKWTRKK
jgi:NMD protein affecting ribosome stability and mRNA decay